MIKVKRVGGQNSQWSKHQIKKVQDKPILRSKKKKKKSNLMRWGGGESQISCLYSCKLVDYKDDEIENLVNIDKWKIPLTYHQ